MEMIAEFLSIHADKYFCNRWLVRELHKTGAHKKLRNPSILRKISFK